MLLPVPLATAVPLPAAVNTDQVSVVLSASVAFSVRANAVGSLSSDMVTLTLLPSLITGALFSGVTVMVKSCVSLRSPSLTCNCTLAVHASAPFSGGVHCTRPVLETLMPAGPLSNDQVADGPSTSLALAWYW